MALALMDLQTLEMAKKRDHKIMIMDENESNEVAITYSMDNPEDERDAEQCFGIDFGDEHSAGPMRDSYSYHLICGSKKCVVISLK